MSMVNYLIFSWKDSKKNWRAGSQTWVRCLGPRCMSSDSKVPSVSGRMVFLSRLKDLPGAGSLATHTGLKPVYLSGVQTFALKKGKKLLNWLTSNSFNWVQWYFWLIDEFCEDWLDGINLSWVSLFFKNRRYLLTLSPLYSGCNCLICSCVAKSDPIFSTGLNLRPQDSKIGLVHEITGKYLSEALIFASNNPQYDNRL